MSSSSLKLMVLGASALTFTLLASPASAQDTVRWKMQSAFGSSLPHLGVSAAVNDMIAPLAVGRGAADIDGLHRDIQRRLRIFGRFGITAFALSGLDIALWDLAGKAAGKPAGKPLHALLGGARRMRTGAP